jgi:hypothetical protein
MRGFESVRDRPRSAQRPLEESSGKDMRLAFDVIEVAKLVAFVWQLRELPQYFPWSGFAIGLSPTLSCTIDPGAHLSRARRVLASLVLLFHGGRSLTSRCGSHSKRI